MTDFYPLYKKFGAHLCSKNNISGVQFTLYAPNAKKVSVVGDFNNWDSYSSPMSKLKDGSWELFIPNLKEGDIYKYSIITPEGEIIKSDPFAFLSEVRPNTASIVYNPFLNFKWEDDTWLKNRSSSTPLNKAINIYEIHLGSWRKPSNKEFFTFHELADILIPYISDLNFTHIEILPIIEHPLDASWGYQGVGYFSITSRYGTPEDFKYFVNKAHKYNIGVILDWVPGHFCKDSHSLYKFDGSYLFEYDNPLLRENHIWGTANFDLSKKFVQDFLISSALYLFKYFHIDGLRMDAISNMIYLEYEKEDKTIKNIHGGNSNLESISFLKRLNSILFHHFPNILIIAEEATSYPLITKPPYDNGLGFNFKWNMGWMNDILKYMSLSPEDRKLNQNLLTFSLLYAFSENFILPISHDEVVHGKKSLLDKMYGDYNTKFKSLKMFLAFMIAHPGKKLLFMGIELAPFIEWRFYEELEWKLLKYPIHDSIKHYIKDLNKLYLKEKAFWEIDDSYNGFQWINHNPFINEIICFLRISKETNDFILVICNFTDKYFKNHSIGIPRMFDYREIFNSDRDIYSGENIVNRNIIYPKNIEVDNQPFSINIDIAPMSTIFLKPIL